MRSAALLRSSFRSLLTGGLALVSPLLMAATVQPFSGDALSAPGLTFVGGAVQIGGALVALKDCNSLTLGAAQAQEWPQSRLGVWLIDGSFLPVTTIGADPAQDDAIQVDGPLGVMSLPLAKILGWGPELPAMDDQNNDRVVVAAGPLLGRIQGITAGQLKILSPLSTAPLSLSVKDVAALRLAVATRKPTGIVLSAITDPNRPPLYVHPAPGLPLACIPGVATQDALTHLSLRVEGGRRIYLSALTPDSVAEEGAFGVVWHWKADTDLAGGPLRLGGVRYAHGLSWALGKGYVHLHTLAGIADLVAPEGDCSAELLGDGRSLWSKSSVKGSDKPLTIDVDLSGVSQLTVKVDFGARYDIGDHFTLADCWLLKVK